MADLLTPRELALWTSSTVGKTEDEVADDEFALEVIDKVSQMAQFLGGNPWTLEPGEFQAPFDVRMVVLQVCKRAYENPKQIVQEGGVGPIGGDRVLDVAALLFSLTETERDTLTKYNADGDPDGSDNVFVVETTRGEETTAASVVLYVNDDQQINMHEGQSAYPSWPIPMFSPGDPGDPNHYLDEV
jgi:hypothetical protein